MIDTGYYTSEALTLLHSLIGIPSISREEEAAADFLQNYIEETGIMTGRSGNRNSPGISSVCLVIKRNYVVWAAMTPVPVWYHYSRCTVTLA